jgi:hypothetical protein|nr:hypothetical protein [uncultured Psychroserpens sp.]
MKTNFKLEKFASANIKTLDANELNSVMGAIGFHEQCSTHSDVDSQSGNCSDSNDVDGKR